MPQMVTLTLLRNRYSGVAWATKEDYENKNIRFITSWPGHNGEESKAPTELWYDDDGVVKWGYEVPADVEPFRWFKPLLLRNEDLGSKVLSSPFVIQTRNLMVKTNKTVAELTADYLRKLWEHAMKTIEKAHGEDVAEAWQFHVVITVPAIWKGYARQDMEIAAREAGILDYRLAGATRLTFAPEPEAAALPTLLDQGRGLRKGHIYMVCDAGGGTVVSETYNI